MKLPNLFTRGTRSLTVGELMQTSVKLVSFAVEENWNWMAYTAGPPVAPGLGTSQSEGTLSCEALTVCVPAPLMIVNGEMSLSLFAILKPTRSSAVHEPLRVKVTLLMPESSVGQETASNFCSGEPALWSSGGSQLRSAGNEQTSNANPAPQLVE